MSTLYEIKTIDFKGSKKPSRAMIMRAIGEVLKGGVKAIEVLYGENWIDLDFNEHSSQWFGRGWIKNISGEDIAKELNEIRTLAIKQIKEHRELLNLWNT